MRYLLLPFLLASSFALAADPITLCVATPNGPEAKNWKLQTPMAHRIEGEAATNKIDLIAPLLASDNEKRAKSEAGEARCTYILLTTIESTKDQVFGTLNPNPMGRSQGDINSSLKAVPTKISIKYKLITPDGKKVGASSVPMAVKDNAAPGDYEEVGRKLVEEVSKQVIATLPKRS